MLRDKGYLIIQNYKKEGGQRERGEERVRGKYIRKGRKRQIL